MALSANTINDIKEFLIYRAKEIGENPLDANITLKCLYEQWDVVTDNIALQAQLVIDRAAIQQAKNDKEKADLEAQGYTVTDP